MKNGEWLRRAGPFEISEPLGETVGEIDEWRRVALASREEAISLRDRLMQSEALIEDLRSLK